MVSMLQLRRTMNAKKRTIPAKVQESRSICSIALAKVSFAISCGMSLNEITKVCGINAAELMDPDSRIPDSVIVNLWHELSSRFPERCLSMEMARSVPLSTMGGLAHGAQFAETL